MSVTDRKRLDLWLLERGLAPTRERAQALVMAGRVRVNGVQATKPGVLVRPESAIDLRPGPEHVGRGALKLAGALDAFGIDPTGRIALDVGASTGGFTEILLARGALRVYAVDVGRAQLHESLRTDPRVIVRERVNARELTSTQVPEPCGLATVDVSFISVVKVLPPLRPLLLPEADLLVLVKPQFEVGRKQVRRGGLVKNPALHLAALRQVAGSSRNELAYVVRGACPSPIAGSEGNREFFLHLKPSGEGLSEEAVQAVLEKAVHG